MFFLPAKHRFCITLHKKLKNLNCIKHLQDPIDLHVFRQHQICNMNIAAVAQWLEHSPRGIECEIGRVVLESNEKYFFI